MNVAPSAHCRLLPRHAASQRWCHLEVDKGSIATLKSHPPFSLTNAIPPFHCACGRHLVAMARHKHICRRDAKVRISLLIPTTLRPHRAQLLTRAMITVSTDSTVGVPPRLRWICLRTNKRSGTPTCRPRSYSITTRL